MNYLKERVAYLKGLADGMQINDASNEGKLLKAIIDVLDDVALAVDDMEEVQEELSEQVDNIDEDLADIEKVVFDDYEDDEDDEEDDEEPGEFECPHCGETIFIDVASINGNSIVCPHCHKEIEIEWECDCDECEEHEHS